jgi:hypothetical protein
MQVNHGLFFERQNRDPVHFPLGQKNRSTDVGRGQLSKRTSSAKRANTVWSDMTRRREPQVFAHDRFTRDPARLLPHVNHVGLYRTAETPHGIGARSPERLGFLETVYGRPQRARLPTWPQLNRGQACRIGSCNTGTQAYCRLELFELIR